MLNSYEKHSSFGEEDTYIYMEFLCQFLFFFPCDVVGFESLRVIVGAMVIQFILVVSCYTFFPFICHDHPSAFLLLVQLSSFLHFFPIKWVDRGVQVKISLLDMYFVYFTC